MAVRQQPTTSGTRVPSTNLALDELPQQTTPLDGFTFDLRQTTSTRALNSAVGITAMTGANVVDVDTANAQGDSTAVDMALRQVEINEQAALEQMRQNGTPPDAAAGYLSDEAQKMADQKGFRDFVLNGALTVGDPNYSPAMARVETNQQIMVEALEERFARAQSQGTVATIADFADRYVLRYLAFGMWEDLTRRSERRGADVMSAMASMSPQEFYDYAEAYAEDLANEGVFAGENWFALQEGMNEVTNAGVDPFATATQVFAALDVLPIVMGATKSVGTLGRIAATRGSRASVTAAENLVKGGAHRIGSVQDEMLPTHLSIGKDQAQGVHVPESQVGRIFEKNELVQQYQRAYADGLFGRVATKEEIDAAANMIVDEVEAYTSRPLVSTSAGDMTGFGEYGVSIVIGKADNAEPIMDVVSAQSLADDYAMRGGFAAEVIEAVPGDPSKGYYVEVLEAIPTAGLASPADISQVTENIITKALGSARDVDLEVNTTLAQMGEGGLAQVSEIVKPYVEAVNKLSTESKLTMDSIWRQLRDGEDSHIRTHYSRSEFRDEWIARTNRAPTEAEIDAYYALQTMSDAAWIMQANKMAVRYVERGFKSIELNPGVSVPARPWGGAVDNIRIKNLETTATVKAADLPEGTTIWKLDRPWDDGTEYVANPGKVRAIQYEDIMPYNAGGRRIYDGDNYFGTIGDRAVLTSFSSKQATQFVDEFTNIQNAYRATGRTLDELTDELDNVIRSNNGWNKSITNTADLKRLLARKGWNIDETVSFKARNAKIENQAEDLFNGMNAAEYYTLTKRRSDDTLMRFGGGEAVTHSPIKTIVAQLSDVSSEYAYRAYNFRAKTAWLKKAMGADRLPKGADVNALFRDFKLVGDGATQRKLRTLRNIIERREQVKGPVAQAMADFGQSVAEWIFDKTGLQMSFKGLEGTLLGMGFQSAFGFFNISQFFLQATHAATIAMISPKHGSRAAALVLPIRLAYNTPDTAARKTAVQRLAKAAGITEADLDEFWQYLRTSGRDLVEQDALEKGTGPGFGVSHWQGRSMLPSAVNKGIDAVQNVGSRAMKLGTLPFNEGERLSRHTGILTAFLEFKSRNPSISALSDQGRSWILRREQDLGFNMSTVSRGAFQSGLMKVPTQWLSYSMRYMGAIVLGRGFTKMERVRLGLSMAMMGGVAGLGFSSAADFLGEKFGLDPEGNAFVGLKYGLPDAIMSWSLQEMTGNDDLRTAFGTRIAPLTAFTDLYRKITEESAYSAIAGPSGEIVGGGASALVHAVGAIFNGNWQMAQADIERVIRTPSAIDNYWKAASMANYGLYQSKTGTTMPMQFDIEEAAMQAAGVTNYRIAEFYNRRTTAFRDSKNFREDSKQLTTSFRRALGMIEAGDESGGYALMREVELEIQTSGYSPFDQQRLRRALREDTSNDLMVLTLDMMRRENEYGARVLEGIK